MTYFLDCLEKGLSCPTNLLFDRLENVDEDYFERIGDELVRAGLLNGLRHDHYAEITYLGVLEVEKRRLIPEEKITRNNEVRYKILEIGSAKYHSEGYGAFISDDDIDFGDGFSRSELNFNLDFLEAFGTVKLDVNFVGDYSFHIEQAGLEQYEKWRRKQFLVDEYNRIANLKPQSRGIELQKLIAKALEFSGWEQEESVKTSYEEVDVVIHRHREFYLIECKWESKPVQPIAINHLLSKLNKRADTKGIVMSMSGFTKGAVKDVEDSTNQKLILLFGEEDVKKIISDPDSFDRLLTGKYKELAARRKAIWN